MLKAAARSAGVVLMLKAAACGARVLHSLLVTIGYPT
jgi:hypothetical protein